MYSKRFLAADTRIHADRPYDRRTRLAYRAVELICVHLRLSAAAIAFDVDRVFGGQAIAQAQTWPTKSLRVVVPFTAASATDTIARIVAERLSIQLGQTFVVENRPGAGGTIGVGVVAKAEPDGYTILVHSSSFTVTPSTYPNTPYNTLRDFSGITPLANLPNVLVIAPSQRHSLGEGTGCGGESEAGRR